MTTNKKPRRIPWGAPGSKVARKTSASVFSAGKRRPVVVSVFPDGVLGLRLLGTRREFFAFADSVYREAVISTKAAEREKRRKAKKGGK
jgi:hypothetical protein